ncbi:MAG TPA: FIST N-terminal domain-containing protein, partial [Flavobacteriales bacterium]|nr:FIST N-terminal domain-containing protein [Flavobacteriales bacterium]
MIRTHQLLFSKGAWQESPSLHGAAASACQLALVFGSRDAIGRGGLSDELRMKFPEARIVFASTAGEIAGDRVMDDTIVATGISFERTTVRSTVTNIRDHNNSANCGDALMRSLPAKDLSAVLLFSDGSMVNGSELIAGMNRANDTRVPITGGLAGDGQRFERTLVGLDGTIDAGNVVVVGLYGEHVKVGHGSAGGWEEFGPQRI